MKGVLILAYRYLAFYRFRSLLLIGSLGLIFYLPFGLKYLISETEDVLLKRAKTTALVIGPNGNTTDMVLQSLYFSKKRTEQHLSMKDMNAIDQLNLGYSIPVLADFEARKHPVVGTTIDYFSYRNIKIENGRLFQVIGECVLGAKVSENLELTIGDAIITSNKGNLDISGVYPLKLSITGVLPVSNSPDDWAVFTDIQTAWVIMGKGHGHQNLAKINDPTLTFSKNDTLINATAKVKMYQEITSENRESFHFHEKRDEMPLNAFLFVPENKKALALLRGKLESGEFAYNSAVPESVITNLLQNIFKFRAVFYTIFMGITFATILIFSLIIFLNIKLREGLINTLYTFGTSRKKVIQIISAEILILLFLTVCFMTVLYVFSTVFINQFIQFTIS